MDAAPEETPAPVETPVAELEFSYKGKQIKAPFTDPRVKQWASQGYDYAQRTQEFATQKAEWESKINQYETTYAPIDKWAKENPEQWKSLLTSWQQAQAGNVTEQNKQAQLPPEIQQKLAKYDEYFNKIEQQELAQKIQKEDSELDAEIESVVKQYPHLDFNAPTQDGKSLMYQVLDYADKRGIKSFADAFYAFNHKTLFNLAEQKGKEAVTSDIQKKTKLGVLGQTKVPTRVFGKTENVGSKSYDDLLNEAKSEYNLG
jgi:chaperonin cofactor prefoldin